MKITKKILDAQMRASYEQRDKLIEEGNFLLTSNKLTRKAINYLIKYHLDNSSFWIITSPKYSRMLNKKQVNKMIYYADISSCFLHNHRYCNLWHGEYLCRTYPLLMRKMIILKKV